MKDKANEIAINPRYDGYRRRLTITVYKFFDKKTGLVAKATVNEEVAQKVRKPVTNKFKRKKVYARLKDNIWAADLVEMESLSSKNRGVKYLLCVVDVFTKYAWIKPLKDKKAKTVLHDFIEIVDQFNCKANKLWADQGKNFVIALCKNG